jgi:hypothetical protein
VASDNPTMINTTNNLPPNLQPFASLPPPPTSRNPRAFPVPASHCHARERKPSLWQVRACERSEVDGRWHYTFSGAGEVFSVVQPQMDKEMGRRVREAVQEILGEEDLL